MQEACLNKVKEKFAKLKPEMVTNHHDYIDNKGLFCFNAMVLDICKGLDPVATVKQYSEVPDRLEKELDIQPATIHLINDVHKEWIYDTLDFDEAVAEVLAILSNDGSNEMPRDEDDIEDYDPEEDN